MARARAISAVLAVSMVVVIGGASPSSGQTCPRVVVFTLPGVTWHDLAATSLPAIERAIAEGATASMSVRTNSARTTYASGFATIGAGTRMDGGVTTGGTVGGDDGGQVTAAGIDELRRLAAGAGYDAIPGALGEQISDMTTVAIGNGGINLEETPATRSQRWPVLAVMDGDGRVDEAALGSDLLATDGRTDNQVFGDEIRRLLSEPCVVAAVDHGDLIRAESLPAGSAARAEARGAALAAADQALGAVLDVLTDDDLLLVVSPTSPLGEEVHFGVAIARGPGFPAGALMSSASTRRAGIVTLPDVAPTILEFLERERHPAMLGRPFFPVPAPEDRLGHVLEDDREAVFVDRIRVPVTTAFVIGQVMIYLAIAWVLSGRGPRGRTGFGWSELAALGVVAFPGVTYLAGAVSQHRLGLGGYVALVIALTAAVVALAARVARRPLDRLFLLTAATCALLVLDVVTGARLQMNTVFSYSPLVAGRFAGFGNTAFAVLGAVTVITGTLIVHRSGRSRRALGITAVLFLAIVIVDGAPMWGSDVGGVLALVPAFGMTLILLAGKRPGLRTIAISAALTLVVLGGFLVLDLARPVDQQTHLARLFEDIRLRGPGAFFDTVGRKVETNLRVFTSTIWTYFVPPSLAFISWLLLRPKGRWERFAGDYPTLRAGLIGGLVLSLLGFAVNDSGIVVPAMVLSYLVPVALLAHLLLDREVKQ